LHHAATLQQRIKELPLPNRRRNDSFRGTPTALGELNQPCEKLLQQNEESVSAESGITKGALEVELKLHKSLFEEAPDGYLRPDPQGDNSVS